MLHRRRPARHPSTRRLPTRRLPTRRLPTRRLPTLLLAALGLLWAGLPAACGYQPDVPVLPGGAHSIAVERIANLTGTGELDVRLKAELERRLAAQAHLRVVPTKRSALALSVRLDTLTIQRVLDPAITSDRSFTFTLTGRVTLLDRRSGHKVLDSEAVTAQVVRLHASTVQETPAIRDEGLNDVLAAFAEQVERRLFRTF